jgi:hypothetical protein
MSSTRWLGACALSVLMALTTAALQGQASGPVGPSEALLQDAASDASQTGVGLDEAVRRIQLQRAIGDLDAVLTQEEPATFAGLWSEHQPAYRVIVRFTDMPSEQRLRARVAGTALDQLIQTLRPWPASSGTNHYYGNPSTYGSRYTSPMTATRPVLPPITSLSGRSLDGEGLQLSDRRYAAN